MNIPDAVNKNITYTLIHYEHFQDLVSEGLSEEVIKILSRIEITYPFTFQEKENLRNKIDLLDNYFWIKNRYGFCELVNQKLAEYFDTSFAQLEENHEEIFFPVESRRIVKSFNDIVSETKKAVRIEGLSFIVKDGKTNFTLINIPIIDEENTIIAIICISTNPKVEKKNELAEKYSQDFQLLDKFHLAAAMISNSGFIYGANLKFLEFFNSEHRILENSLVNEVFTPNFVKIYEEFLASNAKELKLNSSELFLKQKYQLQLWLGKIFDKENNIAAIILAIDDEVTDKIAAEQIKSLGMIENLIRNNPDAVLICDKENLKFLEVNEVAINLYGYRREEFLQMDLTDLYSAEDIQLLLDSSSTNTREGSFNGPYKHKKKDGTTILVEISRYNIKYHDREAHFNLVKNISDKLELEKRNQSFKSAFENTTDLIFITDSSGFIHSINQQVTKVLGYTKNDLINSSFSSLVSDQDRSRVNNSIFHSNKKDGSSLALNIKTINGRFLNVDVIASPILDFGKEIESFTLIGNVIQDIPAPGVDSPKKILEDSGLKEIAKKNIDSKFLADLFHELLTPVNVILGFAQDIADSIDQPTPEQKEASEIIKQNRTNLLQSMNAAIDYASLIEKDLNLLIAETKITDIIDLLLKDIDEFKNALNVELAFGKISSSLKFETDWQKFKYFLSLLFKTVAKISGQQKIYFSAFAQNKDFFLVTFRDLHTHSSKQLINKLQNIFTGEENTIIKELGLPRIFINLVQKLLKILKGKFAILSEEKDKLDYGIIFPINYTGYQFEEVEQNQSSVRQDLAKEQTYNEVKKQLDEKIESKTSDIEPVPIPKQKVKKVDKINTNLQNELRTEALREKIRKKEAEKKAQKRENDSEDSIEENESDELVEDSIEFFDFDLQGNSDDQIEEEEIEIIETSAPKHKSIEVPKAKQTDEKVDISSLGCLYFEDQIDSQVLFSVQMKGLKNLNFAISFEESLPLLESGNYDFIVIDINLQGSYNGLDILRIIRSMPKYENTPVFAVTAYVLPGDQQKFVLAGFNGFISKPIFRDQMIDVLAEVFNETKHS